MISSFKGREEDSLARCLMPTVQIVPEGPERLPPVKSGAIRNSGLVLQTLLSHNNMLKIRHSD